MSSEHCGVHGCTCPDPAQFEPSAIAAAIRAQLQSGIAAALNPEVFAHAVVLEMKHILERLEEDVPRPQLAGSTIVSDSPGTTQLP